MGNVNAILYHSRLSRGSFTYRLICVMSFIFCGLNGNMNKYICIFEKECR